MIINAGVSFVYFFDVPSARFSRTHDEENSTALYFYSIIETAMV